jgi:hypothetical protein
MVVPALIGTTGFLFGLVGVWFIAVPLVALAIFLQLRIS